MKDKLLNSLLLILVIIYRIVFPVSIAVNFQKNDREMVIISILLWILVEVINIARILTFNRK